MGGHLLNGKAQAGGLAAKALGPDAQLVDGRQQLLLQCRVIGVRVGDIQRAEEGFLARYATLSKLPPTPMPSTMGGQGLEPACCTVSSTNF